MSESNRFRVSASYPSGNGGSRGASVIIDGTQEDAESAMWVLLEELGVKTAIEPVEEKE